MAFESSPGDVEDGVGSVYVFSHLCSGKHRLLGEDTYQPLPQLPDGNSWLSPLKMSHVRGKGALSGALCTRSLRGWYASVCVVRLSWCGVTCSGCICFGSWDDSSSVSSGISDTIDNLSTDDINTSSSISSYANTPASSRKNLDVQVRNGHPPRLLPRPPPVESLGLVGQGSHLGRAESPAP